jgi:dihydrofolate reductase
MRKIIVFTNVSLDGYFEAPGHDISGFKQDSEAFSTSQGDPVDALLFGHRTYEMMKFWATPQAQAAMPDIARFMVETPKWVASHTPFDPQWENVTVLSGDVSGGVKKLKSQPGGTILIFGSNTLCVSLLQAGLLDELQIVVNPVLFGEGTPLFKGLLQKADLSFQNARPFKSGSVMLTYTP